MFLTKMQHLGAVLSPAENSVPLLLHKPLSVPVYPGFLSKCCVNLPYSKFSTKKCCHVLAMLQISLDRFIAHRSEP